MKPTDSGALRLWRRVTVMLAIAACVAPALAQVAGVDPAAPDAVSQEIQERYPAGSIKSLAQADQALEETRRARGRLNAVLTLNTRACEGDFFMTACILDAKEQHRVAAQKLKAIEVEANTYKRQARVDARDSALAVRRKKLDENVDSSPDTLRASIAQAPEPVKYDPASAGAGSAAAPSAAAEADAKKAQERQRKAAAHRSKVKKAQAKQRAVAARKAAVKAP